MMFIVHVFTFLCLCRGPKCSGWASCPLKVQGINILSRFITTFLFPCLQKGQATDLQACRVQEQVAGLHQLEYFSSNGKPGICSIDAILKLALNQWPLGKHTFFFTQFQHTFTVKIFDLTYNLCCKSNQEHVFYLPKYSFAILTPKLGFTFPKQTD